MRVVTPGPLGQVVEEHGSYHCEAHNQTFSECKHRYVTQVHVNDYSGGAYVSLFNDQAEALLGQSADSLAELKGADEDAFNRVLKAATFKSLAMRVKSKTDEYNGVQKRKIMVHSLQPLDYAAESNRLLGLIAAM
jgi:replication factor A1